MLLPLLYLQLFPAQHLKTFFLLSTLRWNKFIRQDAAFQIPLFFFFSPKT